ncbi:HEPN domain-containing protein [Marivirga sp. S37H4]|uniref:HEPN domain-containing protein n=1 Tax=Marivirga aurantiaca TaxID=2802615 RepID=A0A934X0P7_9BACT|nr:HEPN domain-containing protein [Marivirga aurantiaca]MBK6266783.1 HEPN domain-containing protein [Marivirga aurantiaca]
MNQEERNDYIKYRIKTSFSTFDAAKLLAQNGYWNSAVNRLYYASFYAVNALLVSEKVHIKSHTSTKTQFSQHFIKPDKLPKKYGILYSRLFDWRQKGDYDNAFEYNAEDVDPLIEKVEEMLTEIANYLSY